MGKTKLSYEQLDDFVGALLRNLHQLPDHREWSFRMVERDPDDPIITILLEKRSYDDARNVTGYSCGGMELDMSEWDDEDGRSLFNLVETAVLETRAQIDREGEPDPAHPMVRLINRRAAMSPEEVGHAATAATPGDHAE